ncbi:hypothetical protein PBCV1_a172L [Paramecium bursaria Chlorella virus 1]|uniref:Uncharacterized protein n=1 Tax=Paramecium bursaria Chlorella virus 1 TaxID=10506 RepID=Q84492_PBCV1|nr:hypothetical protein PBCV1_a172L [Paramecium bursaria Chlorella virus 1]AAC96540.1 hypothetical protein [Paramecium bursaria Chlorella virus 1]
MNCICDHYTHHHSRIPKPYGCFWNRYCFSECKIPRFIILGICLDVSRGVDKPNLLQNVNHFNRVLHGDARDLIAEIFRVYLTFPGHQNTGGFSKSSQYINSFIGNL